MGGKRKQNKNKNKKKKAPNKSNGKKSSNAPANNDSAAESKSGDPSSAVAAQPEEKEKLVDVGFSSMNKRMTKPRLRKLYKLPTKTITPGLRMMVESDCETAHKLLTDYLNKFGLHVHFSLEEFKHCFLTKKGVVYSYVVEDKENKKITDFISFYELPSTIMNHPKYNGMRAAYSYYNDVSSVEWNKIMYDALILAKSLNFDVFNALDVMENETFLKELKFKIGDGHLQYYLFNWKCRELTPNEVALVLL